MYNLSKGILKGLKYGAIALGVFFLQSLLAGFEHTPVPTDPIASLLWTSKGAFVVGAVTWLINYLKVRGKT